MPIGLSAALNVVYFPQLGYLITLPQYHLQRNSGVSCAGSSHCDSSSITEYYQQNLPGFELQVLLHAKITIAFDIEKYLRL